jgi:hypothetical protein
VIQDEKGTFNLKGWVTSRHDDQFEIAAITAAEFRHGVERATDRPENIRIRGGVT